MTPNNSVIANPAAKYVDGNRCCSIPQGEAIPGHVDNHFEISDSIGGMLHPALNILLNLTVMNAGFAMTYFYFCPLIKRPLLIRMFNDGIRCSLKKMQIPNESMMMHCDVLF